MPYLDDSTMSAIEADLAAAHRSLAHGDLDMKNATKTGIKILETVVPAAAFSYLNAMAPGGEVKIGPVPLDLGVGVGLTLLAMFDVAGGYEEDLLNMGIGALASYGARTGAAFGAAAAASKSATATAGVSRPQDAGLLSIAGAIPAHGAHNAPLLAAHLRDLHHVSGASMPEISGATRPGSPVPPNTQRYMVQQIG